MSKNNLNAGSSEPVAHSELASLYKIGDGEYTLEQVIQAVRGDQPEDGWNDRTMADRLKAIKAYLKSVDASPVEAGPTGDTPTQDATPTVDTAKADKMADLIEAVRNELGVPPAPEVELPQLLEGVQALRQRLAEINAKLGIDEGDDVIEAIGKLQTAATEERERAAELERKAADLREEVRKLAERASRDVPLHGFVDDLKSPY